MESKNPFGNADELDALRRLYSGLSDEEIEEAADNFERYAGLLLRVYNRICSDPEAYEEFKRLVAEKRKEEEGDEGENEVGFDQERIR